MNSSPSEHCSFSLQLVSLRLEYPTTSSQIVVAPPRQHLHVVLCVLGYTALLRKIRVVLGFRCCLSLFCDMFTFDLLKLDDLLTRPLLMAFFGSCNPSGRWDEILVHESENVINKASVNNLSCRLCFLLSLDNLLHLNLHLMFFVLQNPSLH